MRQRDIDISSNDNTLFITEQCNNHCLMCCQPPSAANDLDVLFVQNMERIESAPRNLATIGITGGEPTLLGDRLITLMQAVRRKLPDTDIHMLTNGRSFAKADYARRVVEVCEGKLIVGVPLHSDYEADHDRIAGARGSYAETMLGLYNLAACGVVIELRIVMNRLNYKRFPAMARFIHKNLSFVAWTAFMGMERTGYAAFPNNRVWIEPKDYVSQLSEAVRFLDGWHHDVAIYNIPLCLLPPNVHSFARKSISDWKNYYPDLCDGCAKRTSCCGLFATSTVEYEGLRKYEV